MKIVYFKNQTPVLLLFTCMCPVCHKMLLISLYFREDCSGNSLRCYQGEPSYLPQVPSQRIVLKWRCRSWPDGEFFQGSLILQGSFAGRRTNPGREQPWLDSALVPVLWRTAESCEKRLCSERQSREGMSTNKWHSLKSISLKDLVLFPQNIMQLWP